jgi:hypothetical protein
LAHQLSQIDLATTEVPSVVVGDQDVVIGKIVGDYVKRLCGLRIRLLCQFCDLERRYMHAMIDGAEAEMVEGHDPMTCENCKLIDEMLELKDRLGTVEAMMWSEVKAGLDAEGRHKYAKLGAIGICQDWSVVARRSPNSGMRVQVIDLSELGSVFGIPSAPSNG